MINFNLKMKTIFLTLFILGTIYPLLSGCSPAPGEPPPKPDIATEIKPEVQPENFGKPWIPSPEAQKQIDDALRRGGLSDKPDPSAPSWTSAVSIDEMTDKTTAVASLQSTDEVDVWLKKITPSLFIRCKNGKTEAFFNIDSSFNPEYGSYGQATIKLRFDDKKPYSVRGDESTDNKAVFIPNAVGFSRKIMQSKQLLIQFTPFNSSPKTVRFDLTNGKDTAIGEVKEICKW